MRDLKNINKILSKSMQEIVLKNLIDQDSSNTSRFVYKLDPINNNQYHLLTKDITSSNNVFYFIFISQPSERAL